MRAFLIATLLVATTALPSLAATFQIDLYATETRPSNDIDPDTGLPYVNTAVDPVFLLGSGTLEIADSLIAPNVEVTFDNIAVSLTLDETRFSNLPNGTIFSKAFNETTEYVRFDDLGQDIVFVGDRGTSNTQATWTCVLNTSTNQYDCEWVYAPNRFVDIQNTDETGLFVELIDGDDPLITPGDPDRTFAAGQFVTLGLTDIYRGYYEISRVPLPTSLPLLLAGVGGLALMRRRRAKSE